MASTRLRMRAGTLAALFALTAALQAAPAPAGAEEVGADMIWAGPGCPGSPWTCQDAGPVVQSTDTGRDLAATCTLQDCVVTQSNTTGSNVIVVDQDFAQSDDVTVGTVSQAAGQSATLTQTNGSGTNSITVTQDISLAVETLVQVPATQDQEAHQTVVIPEQSSTTGGQDITIAQTENLSAIARAPETTQNQNTSGAVGQEVKIGSDATVGMDTIDGTNTLVVDQEQNFSEVATGPGGVSGTLLKASQTQGSQNEDFEAILLDWKVDSDAFEGSTVTVHQEKNWSQDTSPDDPAFGKTQHKFDEISLIGQLLTPDFADVVQRATLNDDGGTYTRGKQFARELAAEVRATLDQCITINGDATCQQAEGRHIEAQLVECEGEAPAGEECDESTSFVEVVDETEEQGEEGCGLGMWKNNLGLWPDDVQPGQLFGSHFTGAPEPYSAMTLEEAINLPAGPVNNLVRQAVAALLNARHPDVAYALHSKQVREKVNDAFEAGTEEAVAQELDAANNAGCPIA